MHINIWDVLVYNILSILPLAPGGQEREEGIHMSTSTDGGRKDWAMGPEVFLLGTGRRILDHEDGVAVLDGLAACRLEWFL